MTVFRHLLAVVACLPVVAALAADGMSLEQIARLQQVGEIAVSPDGDSVAYTLSVPRRPGEGEDGPAFSELHVVDADGRQRPFVTGEVSVSGIDWTPDGEAITFLRRDDGEDEDGQTALYRIAIDGGEAQRIADAGRGVLDYSHHPDGGQIALVAAEKKDEDLEALREKGFDQEIFEEELATQRLWLKQSGDDADKARALEIDGSVQEVQWSPDGERLAIRVTPRQLVDHTLMFQQVRIIDAQGEVRATVDTPGKLGEMAWSPDGQKLALIATDMINDPREGRLMAVDAASGEYRNLLPGLEGHVWQVGWRDEDEIVFISHEGVTTRLGRIDADGGGHDTLAGNHGVALSGMDVAGDGRIMLTGATPRHPDELYRFGDGSLARMTDSNPWLADVKLARQTVETFTARDGLELQGLLVWPLDYREGERYPLILAVHGGPESHYPDGWLTSYNLPAQHAASQGYFMFYPNYRGSTGRGVDFSLTSQGRPAMEEFDDLVDGVDHLIGRGLVDGERVGITGGSYGGYASAWGATYHSERFAAAVMNVGLSDKIAMVGTSDIPRELYHVHYGTWPWRDWELFRRASPIFHVRKAQTPILILHGDADPRVDPTQSRSLYRYLKLQDDPPPVRLVLYPGEGHGNRRAASRWDYSLRLMRWMNHFLIQDGDQPPPHELDYRLE